MLKPQRGRSRRRATAVEDTPEKASSPCVERGNFTHGVCAQCGWEGPARRARNVALEDAGFHALAGCGLTIAPGPEPTTRRATAGGAAAASGAASEGVPDRERLSARGRS